MRTVLEELLGWRPDYVGLSGEWAVEGVETIV